MPKFTFNTKPLYEKDPNEKKVGDYSYITPGASPTPTPDNGQRVITGHGLKMRFQMPKVAAPAPAAPPPPPTAAPVAGTIDSAPGTIAADPMKAITDGGKVGAEKYGETGLDAASFKPAFAQMLALYQDRLGGYNSQQLAAQRAEQSQMINSQMLAAQRQNRAGMAAQGVRGASALAGNQNLADQAVNARGQMENALLAKQFEAQSGALANYNQFMGQERGTKLGAEFGYGNLYQTAGQQGISNDLLQKYIDMQTGKVADAKSATDSVPSNGLSDFMKKTGIMNVQQAQAAWGTMTPAQKAMFVTVGIPAMPYTYGAEGFNQIIGGGSNKMPWE